MSKQNTLDTTLLTTGMDGRLFVEFDGVQTCLSEVNQYSVNMNVVTVEKQPVGSIIPITVVTGVTFDLTLTEMVVRDDLILEPLLKAISEGRMPTYNFQGVVYRQVDGQEQRLAFNKAVPKGTFGIQSLVPGEVIEREQSFALNEVPQFIKALASTKMA